MNRLTTEKKMTVKEVAKILGVTKEAIRKHIRVLYPELISNGKTTYLNEKQVTEIKKKMTPSTKVVGAVTSLEKKETILKAITYLTDEIKELKVQNNRLIHSKKTYTTTEIAKELNIKSATSLNKKLEAMRIQYKVNGTWVLCSDYAENEYTDIKQGESDSGHIYYDRRWTGLGRDFLIELLQENY